MAEVIFELVPTGNYFIVKGNGCDANSDFLREGIEVVIGDAVTAGDITILGEDLHRQLGSRLWPKPNGRTVADPGTTTTCRPWCPRTTEWPAA